jgi:4-hydroxybenzoate polyprenyltransferase
VKPTNIILMTTVVVVGGTWAKHRQISLPQVIGGGLLTLAFAFGQDAEPDLARQFAWLLLATSLGTYGGDLFGAIGNATTGNKLNDPNKGAAQ